MDTKHKRCPYCGEEILAVAKKCRYCGEWLDADTEKSMTQKVDSIEPEEASTTVDREEKTSFWRKSWKVLSAILVIILFVGIKVGLKEGGRELVKEAAKAQTTKGDTLSDEAQEVYAFKMLKEGDDYFWYLTDGGDNVYVYDDETSYEDFVFPAIVSGELKRRLLLIMEMKYPSKTFWHSAECERHTVDAFNQYGSCVMELPMKERKELDGVDITEVINKAYYDWNPFLVRIVDKGYGFQTYCVRKSQEWDGQRFVRFSRGENDGIKMEINSTNAFL